MAPTDDAFRRGFSYGICGELSAGVAAKVLYLMSIIDDTEHEFAKGWYLGRFFAVLQRVDS